MFAYTLFASQSFRLIFPGLEGTQTNIEEMFAEECPLGAVPREAADLDRDEVGPPQCACREVRPWEVRSWKSKDFSHSEGFIGLKNGFDFGPYMVGDFLLQFSGWFLCASSVSPALVKSKIISLTP